MNSLVERVAARAITAGKLKLKPGLRIMQKDNPEYGFWTVKREAEGVPGTWEVAKDHGRGEIAVAESELHRFWVTVVEYHKTIGKLTSQMADGLKDAVKGIDKARKALAKDPKVMSPSDGDLLVELHQDAVNALRNIEGYGRVYDTYAKQ